MNTAPVCSQSDLCTVFDRLPEGVIHRVTSRFYCVNLSQTDQWDELQMTIKKMTAHKKTFDIAWGDMDALGHVNNARYFDYFQEARIEWLASLHLNLRETTGPVVVHVACTFLKPVVYPATLTIQSSLHSLGRSSMVLDHDLYQGDALMAQGISKIVWVDYAKNKAIPFPEAIRLLFERVDH